MKQFLTISFLVIALILYGWVGSRADPNTASPVTTIPFGLNNVENDSSTITTTSIFQSVFLANAGRSSCIIQNNSAAAKMFVFFGSSTPTTPTSYQLAAGTSIACETVGGVVKKSQVQITGTAGDVYYADQW